MSGTATASGGAGVGPNRRKWDMDEYGQKARERDREEKERAQENEERLRKGQKPLQRRRHEVLAKPTEALKARDEDLDIEKNEGKTLMVDGAQGGRKGPGFYCQVCSRTFKDSLAYLDHVNGRLHLRKLGQTTQVARSTLEQVRHRLLFWQEEVKARANTGKQHYNFEARVAQIATEQKQEKQRRRAKRREANQAKVKSANTTISDAESLSAMGFGSFGSSKK